MKDLNSAEALDQTIRKYFFRVTEYVTEEENLDARVTQIKKKFEREDQPNFISALINDINDTIFQRRCGRSFENSQTETKKFFFMRCVYAEKTNAKYIIFFFVQRAIFIAFFENEIKHTIFHDDRISNSNSEMMNVNESLNDETQSHPRTVTVNIEQLFDYDISSVPLSIFLPFVPTHGLNFQQPMRYNGHFEISMMSQSFDGDSKPVHDLLQLASEDLKISISQTIILFDNEQHVTSENTNIDDAFIFISNVQTVVLWSDHTHHEKHTTFENISVDESDSNLSEKDVNSANESLRLTSENLENSISQTIILWNDSEQYTTIEISNFDTSFIAISNVSQNESVDSLNKSLELTSENLKSSNSQTVVLWSDSTNDTNVDDFSLKKKSFKNQRRTTKTQYRKQRQHAVITTPDKKNLNETASTDQTESYSFKINQNHEDHDPSLHGRTDRMSDDVNIKPKTDESLHTDSPSKRRKSHKNRDTSIYKRTDRVSGDDGSASIKWRKIKGLNDNTDYFYAKSKTKINAPFFFSISSKRRENFEDCELSVQKRTDRIPDDVGSTSIKWRKIESSATCEMTDSEKKLWSIALNDLLLQAPNKRGPWRDLM